MFSKIITEKCFFKTCIAFFSMIENYFWKVFNGIWTVTVHFSFYVFKTYKRQRRVLVRLFLKFWILITLCAFLFASEKSKFKNLIFSIKKFQSFWTMTPKRNKVVVFPTIKKGYQECIFRRLFHPWTMDELPKSWKKGFSC